MTRGAPHYLLADSAPLSVRRTPAGDAWEAAQAAKFTPAGPAASADPGAPATPAAGGAPVLIGMPGSSSLRLIATCPQACAHKPSDPHSPALSPPPPPGAMQLVPPHPWVVIH